MKKSYILYFVIYSILFALSTCYFAEVNRLILLLVIYPSFAFLGIALYTKIENDS